ncbi:MAG: hypothetical protein JSR90_00685 [Proteobacteria bacterium]|nr:hypothetical protein [Pseudomonadota bacterium]
MSNILARLRWLLACSRGSSLIQYSSFALLIAIAAIAITQFDSAPRP